MRCIADVGTALKPSPLPREAWFADLRPMRMRARCLRLTWDLGDDKTKQPIIAIAFAAADLETRAQLLSLLLGTGGKPSASDIEALAADR